MRGLRKRKSETQEEGTAALNPPNPENKTEQKREISLYEQSREERIKANLQRMQQLGLSDLSLKLHKSSAPTKRTPRRNFSPLTTDPSPLSPSGPLRRSSRLQNATPVSYSEGVLAKNEGLLGDDLDLLLEKGLKPEIYTEEHEKLLGTTEKSWELFVDGYGSDGRRIYDQVKGKTCHQCRQKTLGHRTCCSRCNLVQGQFCGDCLYMRYGEHVLEAIENPDWICPACRGICNCSLCRQAKGWPPTGSLYRKISSLGYKSVAHYLIQTRRSHQNANQDHQVSAKRSLPFSDMEALCNESPQVDNNHVSPLIPESEGKVDDEFESVKEKGMLNNGNSTADGQTRESPLLSGSESQMEKMESADNEVQAHLGLSKSKIEIKIEIAFKIEEESGLCSIDDEHDKSNIAVGDCSKLKREHGLTTVPSLHCLSSRQMHNKDGGQNDAELTKMHIDDNKQGGGITGLEEGSTKLENKPEYNTEPKTDSIVRRLRERRRSFEDIDKLLETTNEETSDGGKARNNASRMKQLEVNTELTSNAKCSDDSIATRLRPRKKTA